MSSSRPKTCTCKWKGCQKEAATESRFQTPLCADHFQKALDLSDAIERATWGEIESELKLRLDARTQEWLVNQGIKSSREMTQQQQADYFDLVKDVIGRWLAEKPT